MNDRGQLCHLLVNLHLGFRNKRTLNLVSLLYYDLTLVLNVIKPTSTNKPHVNLPEYDKSSLFCWLSKSVQILLFGFVSMEKAQKGIYIYKPLHKRSTLE